MKLISGKLIDDLLDRAAMHPRRRANHNIHEAAADPVQRYFIAAKRDSYFRPHRHPGKWEFAVVLRGRFDILMFDENGKVTDRFAAGTGADNLGFELPADAWHTWIPLADDCVFLEIKQGPYDPPTAAEFAPWSPAEGAPEVAAFTERMRKAKVGDRIG
jgi:cupin fold WbuC family metalloprotein